MVVTVVTFPSRPISTARLASASGERLVAMSWCVAVLLQVEVAAYWRIKKVNLGRNDTVRHICHH